MHFRKGQSFVTLDGAWSFAFSDRPEHSRIDSVEGLVSAGIAVYPCAVPGNFELDLQANGIIDEPFFGMNIAGLTRYEKCHIWYFRKFTADVVPDYDAELVFEGLDCLADIYLNGRHIGSCDNMLVEQIFTVNGLLQEDNELLVRIRPAVEEAKKFDYPPSLQAIFYESLYLRKAPHMFGWDIMPRAVSGGIWRPVRLQFVPKERLQHVYLQTSRLAPDHNSAELSLHYKAFTSGTTDEVYELAVDGRCGDSHFSARQRMAFDAGRFSIDVPDPKLWWPRGRGDANLYEVTVILLKNGSEIDRLSLTHGIRMAELVRTSLTDKDGNGEFCFKVNGERVYILGTNWVPADAYHSRDILRIPSILELVRDIGCNMVRCWGGNVYENDLFYEICDRAGIMVWQDFVMACARYPQDAQFCSRLETEARKVVRRLRQHPCIVLWSGDNECDWGYQYAGVDPNSNVLTRVVLPKVLAEECCGGANYIPSSPYIDEEAYKAGGKCLPEDHLWGPRDYYKGDFYRDPVCHFASEIGYHGCPAPESMRKFISPDKLWPYSNNEEWTLHSTSPVPGVDMFDYRVELMASQIRAVFGQVPDNLEDFSYASQAVQAEAMKFFIELFRSQKWRKTGIIWWNIMDGWPQLSDAVVDYYFNRKMAYDFIKRSQQPVCLMFKEPERGRQELVACNDTRDSVELQYQVKNVGSQETVCEGSCFVPADSAVAVDNIPCSARQGLYIIRWSSPTINGWNHYLTGAPPYKLGDYRGWLGTMISA